MKRLAFLFVFVLSFSFAFAMEDSIFVKTEPGNFVKLYAWTAGGGPLITMDKGTADGSGIFETTFFSLNERVITFHVMVLDSRENKVRDDKFRNVKTSQAWMIDCSHKTNCSIGDYNSSEAVVTVSEEAPNQTEVAQNSTVEVNSSKVSSNESMGNVSSAKVSGKGIYLDSIKSLDKNVWYIVGGVVLFLIILFSIVSKGFRRFLSGLNYFSEEGKLTRLKNKIRKKERLLARTKEKCALQNKIKEAKAELKKEEAELEDALKKDIEREDGNGSKVSSEGKKILDQKLDELEANDSKKK